MSAAGLVAAWPIAAQQAAAGASGDVTLAETLARFALGLQYQDLPDDVVRLAKRSILDTVGCAIGGYSAGPSQIAVKLAQEGSSTRGAIVLVSGVKTTPISPSSPTA